MQPAFTIGNAVQMVGGREAGRTGRVTGVNLVSVRACRVAVYASRYAYCSADERQLASAEA